MDNMLAKFEEAKQAIFDHVGYKEDWVVFPVVIDTDYFWKIIGTESDGSVRFAGTIENLTDDSQSYQYDIYTQRFLDKWVYRGEQYTAIIVATGVDGNKFFQVFDNAKEVK
jgi:hypothetical protein